MRLSFWLNEPLDFAGSEAMRGEESWSISLTSRDDVVGGLEIHRVPLCTGYPVGWETEMGDDVPGWPVATTTTWDQPSTAVLRRLEGHSPSPGDSLLVVCGWSVVEAWRGLGLEALLIGAALDRMARESDIYAVAEPVPIEMTLTRAKARAMRTSESPILQSLGFRPFKSGVWLRAFPGIDRAPYDEVMARFGLTGTPSDASERTYAWVVDNGALTPPPGPNNQH
jgi:hypothetical protein